MQPEHSFRSFGSGAQIDQRDRRCVRRQDAVFRGDLVEPLEEVELNLLVFDDGFDDQVTIAESVDVGGVTQQGSGGGPIFLAQSAPSDGLVHRTVDTGLGSFCRCRFWFHHDGVKTRFGTHLGNTRTHRSAADDGDLRYLHAFFSHVKLPRRTVVMRNLDTPDMGCATWPNSGSV